MENIEFHPYGFVVGIAVMVGILLVEKISRIKAVSEKEFWQVIWWILLGGILGARLWHVATDFYLYQDNLIDIFRVWHGGLSILGAVAGGILAVVIFLLKNDRAHFKERALLYADLAIFGLPIAQAIGRIGNWLNNELYGLPTNLPWAITIPAENRVAGFEQFQTFHPLFAYEAVFTLLFGLLLWWNYLKAGKFFKFKIKLGTGQIFIIYLLYYSVIRFFLDFLRIDKSMFNQTGLGINQVLLLAVFFIALLLLLKQKINADQS